MKNILIGLFHYPHVNFYKNSEREFEKLGIKCDYYIRPRGNLNSVTEKELGSRKFINVGKHRSSITGKVFDIISSDLQLLTILHQNRYDAVTSIAGISLVHASYINNIPCVTFTDDLEYKLAFKLYSKYSTITVFPSCFDTSRKNFKKYNGFKELAYLSPKYFIPNIDVLKIYGLIENKYILIREQAPVSMVYRHAHAGELYNVVKYLNKEGYNLVFSLEDKRLKNLYRSFGLVLEEPVVDFHSIVKFSKLVISSGDSLSREASLLGIPAIYTGRRKMKINEKLINMGCIHKADTYNEIKEAIDKCLSNGYKDRVSDRVNTAISHEWEDTTDVIVSSVCQLL